MSLSYLSVKFLRRDIHRNHSRTVAFWHLDVYHLNLHTNMDRANSHPVYDVFDVYDVYAYSWLTCGAFHRWLPQITFSTKPRSNEKYLFFSCLGYLALCLCLPDSSRKASLGIYCISWFSKTHPGPQLRMKSFASHAYKHTSVHIHPFMQATSGNHSFTARENMGNNKWGQIHAKIGRLGLGYLSSTEMSCPTCGDCRSAYSTCNHLIYFVPWCFVWFCGWALLRGNTPGPGGPSPQAPSNRSATGRRAACAPESASRNQGHAARYMWRQGWNKKNTEDM